ILPASTASFFRQLSIATVRGTKRRQALDLAIDITDRKPCRQGSIDREKLILNRLNLFLNILLLLGHERQGFAERAF
ncbi:MAG TPA: hypothetical protein VF490_05470, partial [Chryseosolibacter sp.]